MWPRSVVLGLPTHAATAVSRALLVANVHDCAAIPAFVPAIVVVGVVVYVARKDRLDERREQELLERGLDEIPDDLKNIDNEQGDR